jgi:hypothetical protein
MNTAKFALGQVVATPNAMSSIPNPEIQSALTRHLFGDWGDVCPADHAANELALVDGSRLFSVYHTKSGLKFWIITEWDRSATTILLPEDY